ncbi:MAG: hypothetical protein FWD71_00055 [Oscillospiraceae bacterium]|nr:hypothetical protein [Oscillospiraceae bacterium]
MFKETKLISENCEGQFGIIENSIYLIDYNEFFNIEYGNSEKAILNEIRRFSNDKQELIAKLDIISCLNNAREKIFLYPNPDNSFRNIEFSKSTPRDDYGKLNGEYYYFSCGINNCEHTKNGIKITADTYAIARNIISSMFNYNKEYDISEILALIPNIKADPEEYEVIIHLKNFLEEQQKQKKHMKG